MLSSKRGRRGRAAGGLRRRLQRHARRRARDQRAALAVPDRPQPLAQPPAPRRRRSAWTRWTSTCPSTASRPPTGSHTPRGVPAAHRRRAGAARDAAHRAAAARDRCALLRADRRGDGDHGAVGQVAARARPRVAGRGRRGPAADVRGGPRRARRGRRGPRAHQRPGPAPPAHVRALRAVPQAAAPDQQGAGRDPARSRRCCCSRRRCSPTCGTTAAGGGRHAPPPARRPPAPAGAAARRRARRLGAGAGALATKAVAGLAAAAIVTAGAVEVKHVRHSRPVTERWPPSLRSRPRARPRPRRRSRSPPRPSRSPPRPRRPDRDEVRRDEGRDGRQAGREEAPKATPTPAAAAAEEPSAPNRDQRDGDTTTLPTTMTGSTETEGATHRPRPARPAAARGVHPRADGDAAGREPHSVADRPSPAPRRRRAPRRRPSPAEPYARAVADGHARPVGAAPMWTRRGALRVAPSWVQNSGWVGRRPGAGGGTGCSVGRRSNRRGAPALPGGTS